MCHKKRYWRGIVTVIVQLLHEVNKIPYKIKLNSMESCQVMEK